MPRIIRTFEPADFGRSLLVELDCGHTKRLDRNYYGDNWVIPDELSCLECERTVPTPNEKNRADKGV